VNTSMFATNLLFQERTEMAQRLNQLLGRPVQVEMPRVSDWISRFCCQNATVRAATTGSGNGSKQPSNTHWWSGTGKTFSVRTIIALWKAMGKSVVLASPTGRAAKRLSEMTGFEARTIHRLLEFDQRQWGCDSQNPIFERLSLMKRQCWTCF